MEATFGRFALRFGFAQLSVCHRADKSEQFAGGDFEFVDPVFYPDFGHFDFQK